MRTPNHLYLQAPALIQFPVGKQRRGVQAKKRVRFNPKCRARVYEPASPKTPLWYSEQEYQQFRAEVTVTVSHVQQCGESSFKELEHNKLSCDSTGPASHVPYSSRGLECHISKQRIITKQARRAGALNSVMDEQWRQHQEDDFSDEALRDVYKEYCATSSVEAFERALTYQFEEYGHYHCNGIHGIRMIPEMRIVAQGSKAA